MKYENLSSRMERLKQNPNIEKNINVKSNNNRSTVSVDRFNNAHRGITAELREVINVTNSRDDDLRGKSLKNNVRNYSPPINLVMGTEGIASKPITTAKIGGNINNSNNSCSNLGRFAISESRNNNYISNPNSRSMIKHNSKNHLQMKTDVSF